MSYRVDSEEQTEEHARYFATRRFAVPFNPVQLPDPSPVAYHHSARMTGAVATPLQLSLLAYWNAATRASGMRNTHTIEAGSFDLTACTRPAGNLGMPVAHHKFNITGDESLLILQALDGPNAVGAWQSTNIINAVGHPAFATIEGNAGVENGQSFSNIRIWHFRPCQTR